MEWNPTFPTATTSGWAGISAHVKTVQPGGHSGYRPTAQVLPFHINHQRRCASEERQLTVVYFQGLASDLKGVNQVRRSMTATSCLHGKEHKIQVRMQIKIVSPTDKNTGVELPRHHCGLWTPQSDFQLTNINPLDVAILPAPGMMNMLK